MATKLFQRDNLLPLVLGLCDGILTALTLAAGRLVEVDASLTPGLAMRIAVGALVSSAFIFFVARYAELRGELVQAAKQLNLTSHGHLATTQLGHAIVRDALAATAIASGCSFLGALVPLLTSVVVPRPSWIGIATAIVALGVLGVGLARTLYGDPWRWALVLMASGVLLSAIGTKLHIV